MLYTKPNGGTVKNATVKTTQVFAMTWKSDTAGWNVTGPEYVAEDATSVKVTMQHDAWTTSMDRFFALTGAITGTKTSAVQASADGVATEVTITITTAPTKDGEVTVVVSDT